MYLFHFIVLSRQFAQMSQTDERVLTSRVSNPRSTEANWTVGARLEHHQHYYRGKYNYRHCHCHCHYHFHYYCHSHRHYQSLLPLKCHKFTFTNGDFSHFLLGMKRAEWNRRTHRRIDTTYAQTPQTDLSIGGTEAGREEISRSGFLPSKTKRYSCQRNKTVDQCCVLVGKTRAYTHSYASFEFHTCCCCWCCHSNNNPWKIDAISYAKWTKVVPVRRIGIKWWHHRPTSPVPQRLRPLFSQNFGDTRLSQTGS